MQLRYPVSTGFVMWCGKPKGRNLAFFCTFALGFMNLNGRIKINCECEEKLLVLFYFELLDVFELVFVLADVDSCTLN